MAEAKAYKMIPHCTKDTITYEMDELIQCKDCRYCKRTEWNTWYGSCQYFNTHSVDADGFCYKAERKGEAMEEKIELSYDEADDIICFIKNHERNEIPDTVWDVCMRMYEELYG